ncbi:hypothetical protein OAA49_01325 [Flavobacteriales bacterium]|nr:hypothetical protein [Flavobacteriales bacterium]
MTFDKDSVAYSNESSMIRMEVALLIQACCESLIKDGVKLNQTASNNYLELLIQVSDFNIKYGKGFENTIAIALGSNIDSIVNIDVNTDLWTKLSKVEKVSTIYHEVCHDVLNVKHVDHDVLNLMHPFSQPRNFDEIQIMYNKFIRDYKLGRVQKFNEGFFIHDRTNKTKPYLKKI